MVDCPGRATPPPLSHGSSVCSRRGQGVAEDADSSSLQSPSLPSSSPTTTSPPLPPADTMPMVNALQDSLSHLQIQPVFQDLANRLHTSSANDNDSHSSTTRGHHSATSTSSATTNGHTSNHLPTMPPWLMRQTHFADTNSTSSSSSSWPIPGHQQSPQQSAENGQSVRSSVNGRQINGNRRTRQNTGDLQHHQHQARPHRVRHHHQDPTDQDHLLPVLLCFQLPQGTTSRPFRKAVGAALARIFEQPPVYKAIVISKKGASKYGQISFFENDSCNRFLRCYGPRSRQAVMIQKHRLQFERAKPGTVKLSEQEIKSLLFRPNGVALDNSSDYENSEADRLVELFVQNCEIGSWDGQGRFASAWQSQTLNDHYSAVDLDGDTAKLTVRLQDRLISFSLFHLEKLVVHGKDLYIETRTLPMYLEDKSNGVANLSRRIGIMKFSGLDSMTKFVRIPGLDEAHTKVAPFCYVVKVRCTSKSDLDVFLLRWSRKLMDIVAYIDIELSTQQPYRPGVIRKLNEWFTKTSFELSFQVHSLYLSGLLSPLEVWELTPIFTELDKRLDPTTAASAVKSARNDLRHPIPGEKSLFDAEAFAQRLQDKLWEAEEASREPRTFLYEDTGYHQIHAAIITPAGLWAEGPQRDTGNRIIRSYPGKENHFLRVRIQDETGDLIRDSREVDQDEQIFSGKIRNLFLEGLKIAGRLYRFLGFSTSSLREHSTWFVSDFEWEGEMASADSIRATIGDLSTIKVPAKYAARMGQAFTSTAFGIDVPFEKRIIVGDVKTLASKYDAYGRLTNREYIFSDGCGTLSRATMERLHAQDARRRRNKRKNTLPVVFQVRMGGAKGVLSLNSEHTGSDVMLRQSMVKFPTNEVDHPNSILLEVASSADSPLSTNLNRPLVALLETLGVAPANFLSIQEKAVSDLRTAVTDTVAALRLYRSHGVGVGAESSDLLQTLHRVLGLTGIKEVAFLKRCNLTVLTSALRMIKYKARCKVDQAWTLMGIMDESGLLEEGSIYVQLKEGEDAQPRFLNGWCLVGRSPYLASGDVQYAQLIGKPPVGHPLLNLHNCVVFSQKGKRPLPSQLSGGDLDGDLYNVIQNPLLLPPRTARAGDFSGEPPKELSRAVTWQDVVDFFLLYCQTDRLGMIADRHLCIADRSDFGVEDRKCVKLAELASVAVDYQKTGVPPDLSQIPRLEDAARPDFCQSEHRVEGRRAKERSRWARLNIGYYESPKALGQMFRAISVSTDIDSWGNNVPPAKSETEVRMLYWNKIRPWLPPNWLPGGDEDMSAVQVYYGELDWIATEYAPERRREALSEEECFMGVILSRYGTRFTGSRGYSAQNGLKDDFSGLVDQTMSRFCESADWNDPFITPKKLRETHWDYTTSEQDRMDRMRRLNEQKDRVQQLVVRLARWIRASEMFEEANALTHSSSTSRGTIQTGDRDNWMDRKYEGAKWIAIGPALRKIEELELWSQWSRQMKMNMGSRAV